MLIIRGAVRAWHAHGVKTLTITTVTRHGRRYLKLDTRNVVLNREGVQALMTECEKFLVKTADQPPPVRNGLYVE